MNHLFSDAYWESERKRYAQIDAKRAIGLKSGCIECNIRDAHPEVGVCSYCADKLVKEMAFLGISITNPYRPTGGSNHGE